VYPGLDDNTVVLHHAQRQRWLLFRQPVAVHVARTLDEVIPVIETVECQVRKDGLSAAGFLAYEAGPAFDSALTAKPSGQFPLAWFGLYREPEELSAKSFVLSPQSSRMTWTPSISEDEYRRAIAKIKEYIRAGDTYQVNYTLRLRTDFLDEPWPFFSELMRAQRCAYGAFVNTEDWIICCASPELFFQLEGRELVSRPMKGTIGRGLWFEQDRDHAARLRDSDKDRAENVMIVDMVRNDMGRVADTGSVKVTALFDVERYPTLWQMTSTVRCTTGAGITDIFRALFPPASITGAPKARTMQIIRELEDSPRAIYTGTAGFITPRTAQFNVAIRTVAIDKRTRAAEYGTGGGIVWDSTSESEFKECATKARILTTSRPEFSLLETMLWTPQEGFFLLERHLLRLKKSAEYFDYSVDADAISQMLVGAAERFPACPHKVRLIVAEGGSHTLDVKPMTRRREVSHVCLAKRPIDSSDPFLYHKTTWRATYEQALEDAKSVEQPHAKNVEQPPPAVDDVLLWNEKGEITESCIANVVVEMNGESYTPPIHCGLLPGTYRSLLLEQGKVKEKIVRIEELPLCTRISLVNSVSMQWEAILNQPGST